MVYKQFNNRVFLLVCILSITCFLFIWSLYQGRLLVARFTFGVLFILETIALIRLVQNFNKKLYYFMELMRNQGFMERFSQLENVSSYQKLNTIYNEILDIISNVKIEKEIEHQYFQHILQIIGSAIISFKEDSTIEIFNDSAQKLLDSGRIKDLNEFERQFPLFVSCIREMENQEHKLLRLKVGSKVLMLSVLCTHFKVKGSIIKVISFQDIKTELENEELDAWQKLISVLRHEIMNSITHINSLTETIVKSVSDDDKPKKIHHLSDDEIEKIFNSINSIDKRNKGLLKFVETYRNLTKIVDPLMEQFEVSNLFGSIQILLNEEFKKKEISLRTKIEPVDLTLYADEKLLSQVLLNLIRNSIDALKYTQNKQIELKTFIVKNSNVVIQVIDNGMGIPSDHSDKVFIPFFTTKENGTGVGLSIIRNILRAHNAKIYFESVPNVKTTFTIEF